MAVKYKREGHEDEKFSWDVPSRTPKNTRQRLLFIYIGLGAACVFLLMFYLMGEKAFDRWLPIRNGDGIVVEKFLEENDNGENEHYLGIQVTVPPASPDEIGYLQGTDADIVRRSGELTLGEKMATDEASWAAVAVGTRLQVEYQINMQRNTIIIRSLSLNPVSKIENVESTENLDSDLANRP